MNLRIVKKGTGDVRHLVVCYYIGAYADAQLIKSTPDNVCIINDTRTPTRRYTNISQNHKTGIASLQSTVQWITQKLNFNVDKKFGISLSSYLAPKILNFSVISISLWSIFNNYNFIMTAY